MIKVKNLRVPAHFFIAAILISGCTEMESPREESTSATEAANPNYEIASDEYEELTEEALNHFTNLDFDAWGEMLADDVDYYFPDGGPDTRTILNGKDEVLEWFNNWKETSGIEQMTNNDSVHFPVIAKEQLNYSGLSDVLVMSYFTNEMIYDGTPVTLRMNFVSFFNEDKKIYRYYSYYDRTPILNATNENVLKTLAE